MTELADCLKEFQSTGIISQIHSKWQALSRLSLTDVNINESSMPNEPFFIDKTESHLLFQLNANFLQAFPNLSFERLSTIPESLMRQVQSYKGEEHISLLFAGCNMQNIELKGCHVNLFKDLKLVSTYGIICDAPWFTQAHIEEGGNESIAYLHSGIKL